MHDNRKGMRKSAAKKAMMLAKGDPTQKVDASSWSPPEAMEPGVKTGMRPISARQFKRGGKVAHMEGAKAHHHAGRKARKSGGAALSANSLVNRNVKEANEEREGKKHVGGMKRGGMAGHPDVKEDKALIKSMIKPSAMRSKKARGGPEADFAKRNEGKDEIGQMIGNMPSSEPVGTTFAKPPLPPKRPSAPPYKGPPPKTNPNYGARGGKMKADDHDHGDDCRCKKCWGGAAEGKGGRMARKSGGRTKGAKTHINIMIAPQSKDDSMNRPPMPMPARPMPMPAPMPAPAPAPMGGAPMPMPMRPPMGGLPMGRKHGGKVEDSSKPIHIIDNASGGGLGRLQKIKAYGSARG